MRYFLIILLLWCQCRAAALSFPPHLTDHLLINNGWANNYITELVQDVQGRLWIGTESGLYCYNGYEFKGFNTSNSNLNSNMVNALWYDRGKGQLWIGTKGSGVCVMDISTGQIRTIGKTCRQANNIMNITGLEDGRVCLVSQTSMLCWSNDSLRVVIPQAHHGFYRCVFNAGDDILLFGHYFGGVSMMNMKTGNTKRLAVANSSINQQTVVGFVKDVDGRYWIATDSELWHYTAETNRLCKYEGLKASDIFDMAYIDKSEIWLSSRSGVWIVRPSDWSLRRLPNLRQHGSPTHNVSAIYQDDYGNVWLGSMGNGIDFFSHETSNFLRLCNLSVWGIYQDEDGVWAGTTDRLLCFRDTSLVREIQLARKGWEGSFALSINADDRGFLMVAYLGHLLQIDKRSGEVKEIMSERGNPISALTFYRDKEGTLWITTRDGIYSMRQGKLYKEAKLNQALTRQSVHGIRRDLQGKFWIATYENGIYIFDSQKHLLHNLTKQNGFLSNSIQHLHEGLHGDIWLSTPDGMGYIPDTRYPDRYKKYGFEQGLYDCYIRAIQEDKNGNVWVSTNNGISLLRQHDSCFVNYNKYDGIPTTNFTGGAVESGGNLFFTSLDGLCYFSPSSLMEKRELSDINILSQEDIGNHSIRIVFGLSDYAQSRQAEYAYIVEGLDRQWTVLKGNEVSFRNLPPGKYKVALRARLKGQGWDEGCKTSTEFYIPPPLWQRWWAYLMYILLLLGMGWLYFRRYKHRLKLESDLELERQKNIDEQERHLERLQFFTNITHELRTPLTLILGPLEELKNEHSLPEKVKKRISMIYRSSEQLMNLISQLLEFRKTETHNRQLIVSRQDLRQTVLKVGQGFSGLNTNSKLRYVVHPGDTPHILYYDENVLTIIFNNLMSNAAKYTPEGEIEISLTGDSQRAWVSIRDTGYGIPSNALPHIFDRYYQAKGNYQASGTGIGLALVKSLCVLHEIDLEVDSHEGQGSVFTLTLYKDKTYPTSLHKEADDTKQLEEHHSDDTVDTDNQRPVVLVVEDNVEIRHFISSSLSDSYQVIRASDGKRGCEKALQHIPDLIVTDIMMPVMDGTQLCLKLKQDVRTSHIPVIMLTAKDTKADQQEGYEMGADSYLTKPFSISMLRSRITNLLEARRRMTAYWGGKTGATEEMAVADTPSDPTMENGLSQLDRKFLADITEYIEQHISDTGITMAAVGESVNMSHSTLYRKIKALTGLSGNEFIRKVRLRHSLYLMIQEHRNVSEAAYESGFSSLPYFRNCFKDVYGMSPSEYLKQI